MLLGAKNGRLSLGTASMDYIRFGSGRRTLVLLPGLGDGLRTVKGTAVPMALMYRGFCKEFTVYAFSRKDPEARSATTRDMARDVAEAMTQLGIGKADVLGVSMGGMIAQYLAIDYPEKVNRLVLTATCGSPNPILTESVEEWVSLAQRGDHAGLMDSNLRRIYSEAYYRKNRWMIPVAGRLTKPESYDRFFCLAQACRKHDARDRLVQIQAPTLVIGGAQDKALGGDASREIAAAIPGAELKMYPDWGHGLYEEEKTFNSSVLEFLKKGSMSIVGVEPK